MKKYPHPMSITLVGLIVAAGLFFIFVTVVQAATENVEASANKMNLIDIIAAYDADTCLSLISGEKVRKQAKNGSLIVKREGRKVSEGRCRGQTVQVVAVYYRPNKGFRGKDEGSVSCRHPPRRYTAREALQISTHKYNITVK